MRGGSDGSCLPSGESKVRPGQALVKMVVTPHSPLLPLPLQLEGQCTALHHDKHETKAENTKLKLTNQELARELERTSWELQDAQQQLESLQQEACKLHQEKEM